VSASLLPFTPLWREGGLARRPCHHHLSIAGITIRIIGAASRTDGLMQDSLRGLRWMRLLCCTKLSAALWLSGLRRARAVILPLPPSRSICLSVARARLGAAALPSSSLPRGHNVWHHRARAVVLAISYEHRCPRSGACLCWASCGVSVYIDPSKLNLQLDCALTAHQPIFAPIVSCASIRSRTKSSRNPAGISGLI
jgi:hypothetical protein